MIDRDGRIVFGSLLFLVLALSASIVVENQFGVALRDYPVISFLLFAAVLAAPQLYLATTDDAVSTRSRVQFAALATAVFATAFADGTEGARYLLIALAGAGAVVGLLCYEALCWHRDSSEGTPSQVR